MEVTVPAPVRGRCVYGLRVLGLDDVVGLPAAPASTGGEVTVDVGQVDAARPALVPLDTARSVLRLADGRHLVLNRRPATATFIGPLITADLLAHPYLGPVATTFNRWAGREAFHAGAFILDDRAWAVVGARMAGKSSLLAALADRRVPVLSDDILITDGAAVYAGPRCIDLRQPLPRSSLPTVPARLGTRLRVPLPPVAVRVPLGGWLFLRWGRPALTPVGPEEVLARLACRRSWPSLPSDPLTLLRIATRPAWDLTRPRDWGPLPDTVERLVATLAAAGGSVRDAA